MTSVSDTQRDRPCPSETCPACEGTDLHPLVTQSCVVFRCSSCGARWRFELGHLSASSMIA